MPSFIDFARNKYTHLPIPEPPANIKDATYIVTGANTGLGYECAKHLFHMGAKRIILAVRTPSKGEAALATIRSETGRKDVGEVWELDLTSLDSVEAFAQRVNKLDRLDAIIENAGVVMTKFQLVEGIETSVLVNVVSTMLLAFRVLPKLQESVGRFGIQTHLVIVSSNTSFQDNVKKHLEKLPGDIFDALSVKKSFNPLVQYPITKLLEIYAVHQLASLRPVSDTGVIINAVSPGLCYSELDRNSSTYLRMALGVMRKFLARTSEEGSRNFLQAVFAGSESHGARDVPAWVTNETGKRTQKRVWDDLLKRLESLGHGVDIEALTTES
ncbi:Short chain dehydrogenase yanD [Talaromyces pinophilus]|nr:Short chain dehydrogenase yanD [Talaromyces pinophilus]